MKIEKKDDKVIITLDFWQHKNNCYDEDEEKELTHNLVGVVAGDEMTISQLNDLSYKGDQQEGMPLIHFYGEEKEFRDICEKLCLSVWEHELCDTCGKVLYGAYTVNEKGSLCWDCEHPKCTICHKGFATELSDMCSICWEEA